ncbi:MAG: maleylpyruvate isomerase family mycothiol-dependent enzyme, partial [Actinobacteria bacterium]|nr:maleylpyruvate isomerase family mycothiol-dependent enzyme [Actinomycetota bacterium]
MSRDSVFAALQAQTDRLDTILTSLDDDQWSAPSLCSGWSVSDVVLHLAQTEEGVALTIAGREMPGRPDGASSVDDVIDEWVRRERG